MLRPSFGRAGAEDALEHFYTVREKFNRTQEPQLFLYLLARCIKGAVRYNNEGMFNQSPDKRCLGTRPETMRRTSWRSPCCFGGRRW